MIYLSIDCETTGLNPEENDILQVGAVIENTSNQRPIMALPKFKGFLWRNKYVGSAYALDLNKWMFEILRDYEQRQKYPYQPEVEYCEDDNMTVVIAPYWEMCNQLYTWMVANGIEPQGSSKKLTLNIAGKNFATFDKLFLEKLEAWKKVFKVRQRIIDPAILCVDWDQDEALPGLDVCKQRTQIEGDVSHDAVDDAIDVIKIIRASRRK